MDTRDPWGTDWTLKGVLEHRLDTRGPRGTDSTLGVLGAQTDTGGPKGHRLDTYSGQVCFLSSYL